MEVVKRLQEMCDDDHLIRNQRKEKNTAHATFMLCAREIKRNKHRIENIPE
jgi:hypothetical protein